MLKYAKIIDETTHKVSVGLGDDVDFYKSIGMTEMDVEEAWNHVWYLAGHAPAKPHNETIMEQIRALEAQQTPRLMREYGIDSRAGKTAAESYAIAKVETIDAQIAELRKQLEE